MIRVKLLLSYVTDGEHPYTILNECVWHNDQGLLIRRLLYKSLPCIIWHSNCLYTCSLRNSHLSDNLWSSKSLYQTWFKSNTQMAYWNGPYASMLEWTNTRGCQRAGAVEWSPLWVRLVYLLNIRQFTKTKDWSPVFVPANLSVAIIVERLRSPDSSFDASDQQSVGLSPSCDTCVLKQDTSWLLCPLDGM